MSIMTNTVLEQIVQAIADAEDTDPSDLDMPLERFVSTDAIRELVAHESNSWRLQFETQNHVVEVMGDNITLVDGERQVGVS
jgi:hypothetical protein